jgi:hypothetical protein
MRRQNSGRSPEQGQIATISGWSCFRKQVIMFVDKGTICGNIAKFFQDWQCDVGFIIQPGVR